MTDFREKRQGWRRMKRRLMFLTAAAVLLCFSSTAENDPFVMSSSIFKTEWRWEAGATAEFEGTMICGNVSEDQPLFMSLSVDVIPDNTEKTEPVFKTVNGKKQSIKRPKSEIAISSSDQAVRFSGGWTIPGEARIEEATIHLKIYNQNHELLAESDLQMRNDQIMAGESGYRFPEPGNKIRIIAAAAAVIWILALVRIIANRQGR